MATCCCSMAGTRACDNCPNGPSRFNQTGYAPWDDIFRIIDIDFYYPKKLIKYYRAELTETDEHGNELSNGNLSDG